MIKSSNHDQERREPLLSEIRITLLNGFALSLLIAGTFKHDLKKMSLGQLAAETKRTPEELRLFLHFRSAFERQSETDFLDDWDGNPTHLVTSKMEEFLKDPEARRIASKLTGLPLRVLNNLFKKG